MKSSSRKTTQACQSNTIYTMQIRCLRPGKLFILLLTAMIILSLMASSCQTGTAPAVRAADDDGAPGKKLNIIATLFPHYDFTRQIVGDRANVRLLLSPGVESHSYEPTPADIIAINQADLFIYTGALMEKWADGIIRGITNDDICVLGLADEISISPLVIEEHHDDSHDPGSEQTEGHDDSPEAENNRDGGSSDSGELTDNNGLEDSSADNIAILEYDPHIWTSPVIAAMMVDKILTAVCELDPDNAEYYTENANQYKKKLEALDNEFRDIVTNAERREIFIGDRFALAYFTEEYGIEYYAAFDSCSDETEPSAAVIADMIEQIRKKQIPVVYFAELSDMKVARLLGEETGAELLLLHSCHNVTREEFENGATYLGLMNRNAENLRKGLN